MAKHPNKRHDEDEDDDDQFDSNKHREVDKAKIQAETLEKQKDVEVENARVAENQEIANFKGLPQHGETREQLLARIRKMRDETPKEVPVPEPFRSEGLTKEFNAEQEAGKAAVAKAEEERDKHRAALTKIEAEGEKNPAR